MQTIKIQNRLNPLPIGSALITDPSSDWPTSGEALEDAR